MEPLGCLILHGFTSSLDTVNRLAPRMERQGIPYRMPTLRGHCSTPEDLRGVRWYDWYADASAALDDLLTECETAVIMGLSMGGLVALHLAAARGRALAGVAVVAPALIINNPLMPYAHLVAPFMRTVKLDPAGGFMDQALVSSNTNYRWCPGDAVLSLHRFGRVVERQLSRVSTPLLIIFSKNDKVIKPASAEIIYNGVSSEEKELVWFDNSGHEMLQDCAAEAIMDRIETFICEKREQRKHQQPAVV